MTNPTELLERFYNSFIGLDNPKNFFVGLSDYIDFIKDTPEFDQILTGLLDQMKIIELRLNKQGLVASKKLSEIHQELFDYISQNKINNDTINEALGSYGSWIEGKTMGISKPEGLYQELSDIIHWLYEKPEHREFASHFMVFNERKSAIRYFLYPEEYKEYYENLQEAKARCNSELWGQIYDVMRHYQIIKTGREKGKELVKLAIEDKDFKATYELISSHSLLLGEWTSIEEGKYGKLTFFKVDKFKPIIIRFQNYLLKESITGNSQERKNQIIEKAHEPTKEDIFEAIKRKRDESDRKIKSEKIKSLEEKVAGLAEIIKNSKKKKNDTKKIVLYLSKRGELWREPKMKSCYPIEEKSDRHKIVRYFVENKLYDYFPTREIASNLELTTENLMKQIGNINNIAKGKLKIKDRIIEGKRDSGYKINSKYKITEKEK